MSDTRPIQLHIYIANNFGHSHQKVFTNLTHLLIDCANAMTEKGIMLMSPYFQQTLVRESVHFLDSKCPNHKFEHFFQTIDDSNCYFVINDIHKHPELSTSSGQVLYNKYLYEGQIN